MRPAAAACASCSAAARAHDRLVRGAYLIFLLLWGFNYRRLRLIEALPFDAARVTPKPSRQAATIAVDRVNALYRSGRAGEWPRGRPRSIRLSPARSTGALADIGRTHRVVPGRPKRTMLDAYFRRAGVDGMTDPFFLETLIASDLLPFERPFVIAHEWSHLAGIADEGEANFVGWLACLRASPAAQYSGWLFLYRELAQAVADRRTRAVAAQAGAGPARRSARDPRTVSPSREPARVRGRMACLRLVPESQSRRGRRGELRRGRAARGRSTLPQVGTADADGRRSRCECVRAQAGYGR